MSAVFDPYQAWLGIPRHEQPPHHYRLLGIAPLESNPAVIQAAAERQTKILQMQAVGPYIALAQQICGEVAAARYCLLTPPSKSAYDAQLGPRLANSGAAPAPPRPMPAAESLVVAPPLPAATASGPPRPVPQRPQPIPQAMPAAVPPMEPSAGARPPAKPLARPSPPRPRPPNPSTAGRSAFELAKIIIGAIAGLAIAVLILNYFVGIDPLGWSVSSRKEDAKPKKVAEARPRIVTQPMVPSNPSQSPQPRDPAFPGSIGQVGTNNFPPSNQPNHGPPPRNGFNPPPPANRPPSAPPEEILPTEEPRSLADLTKSGTGSGVPIKKSAVPSAADQATKLAQIKDIYKTEFAAAKPGANPELVSFLRTTAAKVEGDPVARYVLYSEAFKQACAGNDFEEAAETLDRLEAEFESEPFAPRYELLTKLASVAKANDERLIVANGSLLLLEHALALGRFEEGDKLAHIADTQTKIIIDKDLRAKAIAALQTTSELAKDQKSVTEARQKLAESPNDPAANLAVGRYRCLIEGNWSAGLAHLAKCDDDGIKQAAALDAAGPSGEVTAGKIGDAWYDLAKAGTGQNFYARADYWYQKGVAAESGLAQVRLKKRHEEIAALKLPPRVLGQAQEQLRWPAAQVLVSGGANNALIWQTLEITSAKSKHGAKLVVEADKSVSVSGKNEKSDVYTLEATFKGDKRITAVRLEVLPGVNLPAKGPGRAHHGNFSLTTFAVDAAPIADSVGTPTRILFSNAYADFSQDQCDVRQAINDNLSDFWAVVPRVGEAHEAVFEAKEPFGNDGGTKLTITLDQSCDHIPEPHNLGHFRLSVTTSPSPAEAGTGTAADLLPLVNQQTIKPSQGWTKNGGSWRSPAASQDAYAFFECSFQPPGRDYTMKAHVTRSIGRDTKGREAGFVTFGLTQRGKRFAVVIDEVSSNGQRRAYLTMGSAGESQNTSVVIYPQLKLRSDDIVCNVTKDKITVWVSGSQLLQYTGDMSVLALPSDAKYPPSKAFFYAQQCGVNVIDHWSVGPLVEHPTPATPAPEAPPSRPRTSPKVIKPGPGKR